MISSSANFGTAIKEDSRDFTARLSVNGVTLNVGIMSMSITKGSCGSDQFGIGEVISSRLNMDVKELTTNVKGDDIKVEIGLMVNGAYEYINLGYFTVTEVKKTPYRATITAYGHTVSKTNMVITGLTTQTLASVKNAVSSACGYNVTLPNSVTTTRTIAKDMNGLTAYQCLQVLASVIGGYVVDVNDGSIAIKLFDNTPALTVKPEQMVTLPDLEEYDFTISGFQVTAGDTVFTYGTADVIIDNPYMTQDLFDNEFTPNLYGYSYRPATIDMSLGDPRLEGDDVLTVYDFNNNTYTVPCHQITHTYDGGLMTHFESIRATQQANSEATPAPISSQIKEQEKEIIEVGKIASNTNQYFWFNGTGTDTGAHITEVPQDEFTDSTDPNYHSGGNLLARSNGIAVRDGMTELATFGATGATIGVTSDTHMELDAQSLKMIDRDADSFFVVSDARDSNGRITDKFVGNGTKTSFLLRTIASTIHSVTINGTATTAYTTYLNPTNRTGVTFTSAPANNASISVIYTPQDGSMAKYLTFGNRDINASIGATSVGIGTNVEASGLYSEARGVNAKASGDYGATAIGYNVEASGDFGAYASGYYAKASGIASHAEGYANLNDGLFTEASGGASHAEGTGSQASGSSSHAEGYSTIASSAYQHTQGKFNVADSSNIYADIVGNGTDHTHRKNISALEWAGNLRLKGDVYVGCNDDSTGGTKLTSGGGSVTFFGTSSESASTVAKTVTVDNSFALATGVEVSVKFTNTNSASNPTLNVNGTGAIAIKRYGTTAPSTSSASSWMAGSVITLTYDGTYWQMHDWLNSVTGVKGNAESTYRTGSVNLTPANIGAVPTSTTVNGHALTSNISVTTTDLGIDDYVTSKGSSGDWTYRKWNSGRVEAWYTGLFSFGATTKATNSYYADGTLAIPNGIFTSTPNCIASSVASSAGAINSAVFSLLCLGASSTQLTTRAFRVSANSSSNWQLRGNVYAWTN